MKKIIADLAVERGTKPEALKKWKTRGRVPDKHRLPMLALARKKGVKLLERDFDFGRACP